MHRQHLQYLGTFAFAFALAGNALAQTTYEQRHADYFDDISTRGINTGQKDGPHRSHFCSESAPSHSPAGAAPR
jgi:hypothetical protein